MRTRARTGPRSSTRTATAWGVSTKRVLARGRVVVRVAEVAAVHQAAVAGCAVQREGAVGAVDVDADQPVAHHDRAVGLVHLDRVGQRGRGEGAPAVAGHLAGAGGDPARRRLVHGHPDHGVGPRPEPRVDILLGLRDGHVGLLLGADGDGDVDALLGVLDPHVVDPGVVADPRSLQHAQHRAHGVGIEDHRSGQPGPLGEHLHVRRRRAVGRDDQLHQAGAGPGRRVEHRRARLRQRAGEGP